SKRLSTEAGRSTAQARTGPRDAFEVLRSKVLKLKEVAHELPSALRNDYAVRLRNCLQACRKVRCLADDCLLQRSARADQITDDHKPCGNAYARLKWRVGLQAAHSRYQLQPSAHGTLCVVLVRLRVTEIDKGTVAHVLRDEPAEALHGVGDAFLV